MNRFLDHTGGVLTLVSLTATVVWGLIATDRLLLTPRARLLSQAVHRATAAGALGFLLVHVCVKVAEAHASPAAALVPFSSGVRGAGGLLGLGALAAYLMVLAGATGALRSAFAGKGRARRWRALHACAYPAWCAAVLHGLKSGRPPAGWVAAGYGLCLVAVAAALVLRLVRGRPDGSDPPASAAPSPGRHTMAAVPVRTVASHRAGARVPGPRTAVAHAPGAHSLAGRTPAALTSEAALTSGEALADALADNSAHRAPGQAR
ncbi:hypothetical protein ACFY1P_13965 [Streptomyces sp. NPDC001407]|uniref:hypothetical protein n=1 Tax=unclassified Streptomyces TaxID=2593676 RepID=UPI0036993649